MLDNNLKCLRCSSIFDPSQSRYISLANVLFARRAIPWSYHDSSFNPCDGCVHERTGSAAYPSVGSTSSKSRGTGRLTSLVIMSRSRYHVHELTASLIAAKCTFTPDPCILKNPSTVVLERLVRDYCSHSATVANVHRVSQNLLASMAVAPDASQMPFIQIILKFESTNDHTWQVQCKTPSSFFQ